MSLNEAWDFFSSPNNLSKITPPEMRFVTHTSLSKGKIYPGQIISYSLRPLLGIKFRWITEITHVIDQHLFVDEQRFGPYKFWHHLHRFECLNGSVVMEDLVNYALPFGIIGRIAHRLFIRKELENIFNYREKVLLELFK
ncbi:MAG: SRPBCC family protein [bacterium]